MKDYIIINTRNFDVQCVLIGHEEDRIVILENRQYLPISDQKVWEKKLPEIIEKIENDYPDKEKIFLFPESTCLNLTIEIPEDNNFTLEQRIAHILYKNFHFYPSKMGYKFWNLDKNRYAVVLISKKFLKFIQKSLPAEKTQNFLFFPPFIGLLNYFKNLELKESSIAIFYENNLRRFFIKNEDEINFIDFYQTSKLSNKTFFKDIRSTQQLIAQSLNIDKNNKLFLFGDIPEGMKEIYEEEYKGKVDVVKVLNISGVVENVSVMTQALYLGLDQLINVSDCPLKAFNFSSLILHTSLVEKLKQRVEKHKRILSVFLWLWLIIALLTLSYACYENTIFRKQLVAFNELQKNIKSLKKCNKTWKKQNETRCFIPKIFLKYYDVFQALPGKFCIDGMGIDFEEGKTFCCIKGRIYENDFAVFEESLSKALKSNYKIDLKTEIVEEKKLHYRIKIPVKIPKQLR